MIVLDELNTVAFAESIRADGTSYQPITQDSKKLVSSLMWLWFDKNLDRKLTTIRFLGIFRKSIYVRDLRDIFTLLFGPRNGVSEGS